MERSLNWEAESLDSDVSYVIIWHVMTFVSKFTSLGLFSYLKMREDKGKELSN